MKRREKKNKSNMKTQIIIQPYRNRQLKAASLTCDYFKIICSKQQTVHIHTHTHRV